MPGKGFCAKNMAVIIAISDILYCNFKMVIVSDLQISENKELRKKQVVNLRNASVAHLANPCGAPLRRGAPFEKRWSRSMKTR